MIRFPLIAALCLFSLPALADGRADWRDYAWQKFDIAKCLPVGSELACPFYHQKWDWKRTQWVDIAIMLDPASGKLSLTQQLTNNDKRDEDHVCVTALLLDGAGRTLLAHHQNWDIVAGQLLTKSFVYTSPRLAEAQSIHIGSKQCREGEGQDDAVYARVLAALLR